MERGVQNGSPGGGAEMERGPEMERGVQNGTRGGCPETKQRGGGSPRKETVGSQR